MADRPRGATSPADVIISILADQLGSGAGGGRFSTGFLRALLSDARAMAQVERVDILVTETQPVGDLQPLPPRARVVRRRFPSRLRQTVLADWAGRFLPAADVGHGLFFYVFPGQGRRTLFTMHDASTLDERFHEPAYVRGYRAAIGRQLDRGALIVCDSQSMAAQVREEWPQISDRCMAVYPGVDALGVPAGAGNGPIVDRPFILAVGTVEPRKNYSAILDAYERLRAELGGNAPILVVAGRAGWMCKSECRRLSEGARLGQLRWVQHATDAELARLYESAAVFTYLSLYEGFGYPPFEAAMAGRPMVLSSASSVGEIWSGYARCSDPRDVRAIVEGWIWALNLGDGDRRALIERQRNRAAEFSWERSIREYFRLYESLGPFGH